MALSDAEKKKIEEEEKYRSELRNPKSKKKGGALKFILIVFLIFTVIFAIVGANQSKDTSTEPIISKELNANVNFDGQIIHITNQETEDLSGCVLTLNSDYRYPFNAYKNRLAIKSGEVVDIYPSELTLSNGTKFNASTTKLTDFGISCEPNRNGFWQWN